MKEIKIISVSYCPGYGDMRGEYHEMSLRKDKEGNWNYISSDRAFYSEPTVITTYSASEEAVDQFEEFLAKKKVFSLENRPKSDMFMTDYRPWSWSITYETTSFGKTKREYFGLGEYKRYNGNDYSLINELSDRFTALRGEKLSEVKEENN